MRYKDDIKAARIRASVIEVVLNEGFGGASISKIAKRADVAPATVYVYHANKEAMLQSIFIESAEEMYSYILRRIPDKVSGRELIDILIRSYYSFMTQNRELFEFIEQYSNCPALLHKCSDINGFRNIINILDRCSKEGIFRPYDPISLYGMIFNPVKIFATNLMASQIEAGYDSERFKQYSEYLLSEIIEITKRALLP